MFLTILSAGAAVAENIPAVAATTGSAGLDKAALAIGAAFCISIGVLGASKAMGNIASSAIEGTARQPEMSGKLFTTMLIAMALVEALAIYCLLIAFMLFGKL